VDIAGLVCLDFVSLWTPVGWHGKLACGWSVLEYRVPRSECRRLAAWWVAGQYVGEMQRSSSIRQRC